MAANRVKLQNLLRSHDQASLPQSLPLSLGDGYLYEHSFIFRNIRNSLLHLRYALTNKDFCHYAVFPYGSLQSILEKKLVPYFDNVTVLKEIEANQPAKFYCDEILMVKANHCLHESSHCIADEILKKADWQNTQLTSDQMRIFQLIMAEAFANTVESLANLVNDSNEAQLFYELNSHVTHDRETESMFKTSNALLGYSRLYRFVYLSYLFSNCLLAQPNARTYQQILNFVISDGHLHPKPNEFASLRKVFGHAYDLSFEFRTQTTGFYSALMGLKGNPQKLLQIDILRLLSESELITSFLDEIEPIFKVDSSIV